MLAAEQVVQAVAALLMTVSGMGSSVFTDHPHPFPADQLPVWRVTDADEEIIAHGANFPARNTHELIVRCEGLRKNVETIRADLNAMAAAALTKLFASRASTCLGLGNTAMVLARIERDTVAEGQATCGRVTLSLRVRFHTASNAPETII
jgi:hypothetical protein